MRYTLLIRHAFLACLVAAVIFVGNGIRTGSLPPTPQSSEFPPLITTDPAGNIWVEPLPVAPTLQNRWTPDLEDGFWLRANDAIRHFAGRNYGSTAGENEKRSYPFAMFDFLGGDRQRALAFLQRDDAHADNHAHTEGIDYYFCFTLKGQMRKYFFFGKWLDPAYRQRMVDGARHWTEQDPVERPHPIYGMGNGTGNDWSIQRRGRWVDSRNTDNLRAMREVAVYLMAEETGNETTRQLYKQKLQRYVWALYNIGMGEWDSENYHGHTFAAYLNLYDFAKDPEVQRLGKAALDWLAASAAVKYYHGGWGGPTKRDYGNGNDVFGSSAARLMWQYFGDALVANPDPERDAIHGITSAYRPPLAVMALAHKQFARPVELLSTKPTYQNWQPGGEDAPLYWETTFFGQTYQMGSVASPIADGDVGPFKLMAANSQRGVDFFVANTGEDWVTPGKHRGDQIGQYRNLLIWLSPATRQPFAFQLPKTAIATVEDGIWFFQLESTWIALHPIALSTYDAVEVPQEVRDRYPDEQTIRAEARGDRYVGFALEIGEPQSHGSYAAFKQAVKTNSRLDMGTIAQGTVQLTSSTGTTLTLTHNPENHLPILIRNGRAHNWASTLDLYHPSEGAAPISLGWKRGKLRVEAGGEVFETTVGGDRLAR